MKQKTLPVGDSNFKSIIEDNCYYVDKTLMIKELIDNREKYALITRP